jgi:hypothetical protein
MSLVNLNGLNRTIKFAASAAILLTSLSAFAAKVGTVSGDSVTLFGNPDKDSSNIGTLHNGDVVTISNYPTKGYYKARTADGQVGWIDKSSLLVGENAQGSDVDNPSADGQATPTNPGAAQVITPPANQDPQSADNLVPAPPSTPDPVNPGQPKEEIPEVPPPPALNPTPATAAQNLSSPPEAPPAPIPLSPANGQAAPLADATLPPAPLGDAAPGVPVAPSRPANTGATGGAPVRVQASPAFTFEDVEPGLNYEVENHLSGPRPVEHYSNTGRKLYTVSLFVGGDLVSMSDMNALLGSSAFTSTTYFGGEFGYALTDEVKLIGRVEYLTSSNNGGTANLNLSSAPVYVGIGFQLGRWKYVHFYASGLVGIGFNTQITATAGSNQASLSESTFTEMVKFDAAIPIHKAFGAFLEAGYRFLKTSSLSPQQINSASTVFENNGSYPPTAIDMSGPFFGGGASFQF